MHSESSAPRSPSGRQPIIVVSGLPRSGTSMMMAMLKAGGVPILAGRERHSDPDNPAGYYEYAPVRRLNREQAWMKDACGMAVKIVSPLLLLVPADYCYEVIFMERSIAEILASQREMLLRAGRFPERDDGQIGALYEAHLAHAKAWLARQAHLRVRYTTYRSVHANPRAAACEVAEFLRRPLDTDEMVRAVQPSLYRSRL